MRFGLSGTAPYEMSLRRIVEENTDVPSTTTWAPLRHKAPFSNGSDVSVLNSEKQGCELSPAASSAAATAAADTTIKNAKKQILVGRSLDMVFRVVVG